MELRIENGTLLWTSYELEENIVVPDGVRKIGAVVFGNHKGIKSITIPDSVMDIAFYAFRGCRNLTYIRLPEGLTEINMALFNGCESLKEITVPENVKAIRNAAFEKCISLEEIVIPKNVKEIDNDVFNECKSLRRVILPDSLKRIGMRVFDGCTSLETIKIGRLTEINVKEAKVNISQLMYTIINRNFSEYNSRVTKYILSLKGKNMRAYIINNFAGIVNHGLIDSNDIETLSRLMAEKDFFTRKNIDECIQYAIENEKHEIYIMLVNYKAERFGMDSNLKL
jgi:hypothetical protein